MDDAELLFLIWRSLSNGPLNGAARVMEQEATRLGLLPSRVDIAGSVHQVPFAQHSSAHAHVSPDALRRLLQKLLEQNNTDNADGGVQVVSLTAPGKHGLLGCDEPPLPRWRRRPHVQASLPHQLLLRHSGVASRRLCMPGGAAHDGASVATRLLCRQMHHLTTVRGHRLAVYCCTYDNTGQLVMTGSDDYLVKIWSTLTGTLLKSCRGHDAEITDFAVSCDNSMLASGDVAHCIRVWSLQGETLGWPVAVLTGHTNVVSYLDFHPQLTEALLSCSTDGTCRVWNARDPGVVAIVLWPSAGLGSGPAAASAQAGRGRETSPEAEIEAAELGGAERTGVETITGGGRDLVSPTAWAGSDPSRIATADPGGTAAAPALATGLGSQPAVRLGRTAAVTRGSMAASGSDALGSPPQPPQETAVATAAAAVPPPADPRRPPVGFLCCSWSPDGAFILAGGTDCTVCVWHWDLAPLQQQIMSGGGLDLKQPPPPPAATNAELDQVMTNVAWAPLGGAGMESLSELFAGREWPHPTELSKLCGHRNDIVFIEFSHEGAAVATASRDGCVKIWRRERDRRRGRLLNSWREAMSLACPPTEEEIRKARLKRKPPPHPAINQVAWNLDDSRMVAAVTDNSVRVWDMASGAATFILLEHTAQAHVLEAHPQDARLVMSGGYDGRTILWDVVAGTALRMFSTQDSFPGRGRWTDPLQLVDGHFSPDGAQMAVSDTAGQLHLYGLSMSAAAEVMARAPYDQFLASDFNSLVRDINGWVLDELTQQPPHLMSGQTLCDFSNHPQPLEVQRAFATRRLADLPRPHPVDRDHPLPSSLLSHPPTLVSASWLAIEHGASATAVQQAMNRAYERHMMALEALSRPDGHQQGHRGSRRAEGGARGTGAAAGGGGGGFAGSDSARQRLSNAAAAAAGGVVSIPRGVYLVVDDPTAPPLPLLLAGYDSDDSRQRHDSPSSSGSSEHDDDVISVSDPGSINSSDEDDSVIVVDSDDGQPVSGGRDGGGGGGRTGSQGPAEKRRGGSGGGGSNRGDGPVLRRSSRRERAEAREQEQQERIRRSARLSGNKRQYGDGDNALESYGTYAEDPLDEQLKDEEYGGDATSAEEILEDDEDESGDDNESRRRQHQAAIRRQRERERERQRRAARRQARERSNKQRREQRREDRRRRQTAATAPAAAAGNGPGSGVVAAAAATSAAMDAATAGPGGGPGAVLLQVARKRSHEAGGSRPRPLEAYSWLQCSSYLPGFYCPQLGDEVVYVRAGHEAYLEAVGDKRAGRPWWQLTGLRACEPCVVVELGFEILREGAFCTVANLKLRVCQDSGSPAANAVFPLQLAPPAPDQPADFLVPLPRFKRAVAKRWRIGERCKTYQDSHGADGGGGTWHGATVVLDRAFPELVAAGPGTGEPPPVLVPYECEALWDRYGVVWDGEAETTYLSPWDMLPLTSSWDDVVRFAWATAAAKADEIVAAAAAASVADNGPSTSSLNPAAAPSGGNGGAATVSKADMDLGGGWAEEQASAARLALERLFAEERLYGLFFSCPPPNATYPCDDGDGRPVPYNAIVPLPMSLELIEQRLDHCFYRSLAAVSHDMDTLVSNAERFNDVHSPVAQRARNMRLHFTAALTGRCVEDLLLLGPHATVRRSHRRPVGQRGRRTDLSRLWSFVTLDLHVEMNVDPGVLMIETASGQRPQNPANAIRGGADAAGGVTGPRRRGGVWVPQLQLSAEAAAEAAGGSGVNVGLAQDSGCANAVAGPSGGWPMYADINHAGGSGGGGVSTNSGGLARDVRGRFAPQSRRQLPRQRGRGTSQAGSEYEAEDLVMQAQGRRVTSPLGRSRRLMPPSSRQQPHQLQPLATDRPRRERAQVPGRFAALLGSDGNEGEDAELEESDSDADGLGQEGSDSDTVARVQKRWRQQQRGQSPGSGRQIRSRVWSHQPQPLRRSARARQRTRYGSDWEDAVTNDDEDDDSDDQEDGGVGSGRDQRRTAVRSGGATPQPRAVASPEPATTACVAAREQDTAAADVSDGGRCLAVATGPHTMTAVMPVHGFVSTIAASHIQSAMVLSPPPPPPPLQQQKSSTMVTATGAAGAMAASAAEDVAAGRSLPGAQGRLKIRLRPASATATTTTATPTAVRRDGSSATSTGMMLAPCQMLPLGVALCLPPKSRDAVGKFESAGGVYGMCSAQRDANTTAVAGTDLQPAPAASMVATGRSRRAAAVAAMAAVAATVAAIADQSDEDYEDDDSGDTEENVSSDSGNARGPPSPPLLMQQSQRAGRRRPEVARARAGPTRGDSRHVPPSDRVATASEASLRLPHSPIASPYQLLSITPPAAPPMASAATTASPPCWQPLTLDMAKYDTSVSDGSQPLQSAHIKAGGDNSAPTAATHGSREADGVISTAAAATGTLLANMAQHRAASHSEGSGFRACGGSGNCSGSGVAAETAVRASGYETLSAAAVGAVADAPGLDTRYLEGTLSAVAQRLQLVDDGQACRASAVGRPAGGSTGGGGGGGEMKLSVGASRVGVPATGSAAASYFPGVAATHLGVAAQQHPWLHSSMPLPPQVQLWQYPYPYPHPQYHPYGLPASQQQPQPPPHSLHQEQLDACLPESSLQPARGMVVASSGDDGASGSGGGGAGGASPRLQAGVEGGTADLSRASGDTGSGWGGYMDLKIQPWFPRRGFGGGGR